MYDVCMYVCMCICVYVWCVCMYMCDVCCVFVWCVCDVIMHVCGVGDVWVCVCVCTLVRFDIGSWSGSLPGLELSMYASL